MVFRAFRAVALATGLLSLAATVPVHAQSFGDLLRSTQGKPTGAFGSMAIALRAGSGVNAAPQWRSVLTRLRHDRAVLGRCLAEPRMCDGARQAAWAAMVRSVRGQDKAAQLAAVNGFFNAFPYRSDRELYGRSEYWASPAEFLANSGDCEDYAIAKYFTLRELGFSRDEMKVVIVNDTVRGIGHAVLTVQTEGGRLVLDNLRAKAVPESQATQYVAVASMNEAGVWVDVPAPRKPGWDRVASLP